MGEKQFISFGFRYACFEKIMKLQKLERREFLKYGLSLPLFASYLSSCKDKFIVPNGTSVIIIGAGISGLTAAKMLSENGFDVRVLEAQEKIGGRTRTNRILGIDFDEGASWIHGIKKNPITDLAEKAGMLTFETVEESIVSYDIGGRKRSGSLFDSTETRFYEIMDTLTKKGNPEKSFGEVFQSNFPEYFNDRLWQFFLSAYVTFDTGDLFQLSSLLYDEGEIFGSVEKIATNGYDKIPEYLANDLDIKLNQKVTEIDYSGEKIKVTHNGKESLADRVIVTIPLGVLKNKVISFSPQLPENKLNAIEKIGMNCVNKFLLTWEKAFWDDVQYITYTPDVPDRFNYFVNVNKYHPETNALMTFAYADDARATEKQSDAEVISQIMIHLKDIYGSSIPQPTQMLRTKWGSNPTAYGAYSFTAVETEMSHFDDLAATVNQKLFFAGEHTEKDYFSTTHGAYLSGIREAEKILEIFKK